MKLLAESGRPVQWTEQLLHPPYQVKEQGSVRRGILTSAGTKETMDRVTVSLRMLRYTLKSVLPVEIYYYEDEGEDEARLKLLEEFGAGIEFKVIARTNDIRYGIKNRAMIESSFTHFVWLDSDTIPLVDPDTLFDSVEMQRSGNVWWPDVGKDHPDNSVWRVLGRWCSDEDYPAETGQVVFDKRGNNGLNLAALHMAAFMMDNYDTWGEMSAGDKDTFRYAFYALGLDYQMAPRVVTAVGQRPRNGNGEIEQDAELRGYANLHCALTPMGKANDPIYRQRPGFLHANVIKIHPDVEDRDFLGRIRRPKIDAANDTRLLRTPNSFRGYYLRYDLYGPDDGNLEDGKRDGQGIVEGDLVEAWRDASGRISEDDRAFVKTLQELGKMLNLIAKGQF